MTSGTMASALSMRGVEKRFGSTRALNGVDLEAAPGEVHAIIGENGAGKSTLMNVLCGVVRPDAGEILLGGGPYHPRGPAHALASGLAMIHQELTIAPHLSVEANILLGLESSRAGFLSRGANRTRARQMLSQLSREDIPLDAPARALGIGERQVVEIARALAANARIVVMDEPTSSLSAEDRGHLFQVIRNMKQQGICVLYISHYLEEIEEIADRYTVLRDGSTVGTGNVSEATRSGLISMMIGRRIEEAFAPRRRGSGGPVLRAARIAGRKLPRRASFELMRGEILGITGLVGAGRTETLRAIFGLDAIKSGTVAIVARDGSLTPLSSGPVGRIRRGIGMLSEDRKTEGLAVKLTVGENIAMASPRTISRLGWINTGKLKRDSEAWISRLAIRSAAPGARVDRLSGGNQQKVALARLMQMRAEILLLDEPTRGIDIGSKLEIYRLMGELAEEGRAILFVSSYLPELMGVCDRIGVMARGELVGIRRAEDWTEHQIMEAATGKAEQVEA